MARTKSNMSLCPSELSKINWSEEALSKLTGDGSCPFFAKF